MNKWYKKLFYRVLSLDFFSRRYYVYQDTSKSDSYYVKTTHIFSLSKYIKIDTKYIIKLHSTFWTRIALKRDIFRFKSKEEAIQTISLYKEYFSKDYKLKYKQIYKE